MRVLFLLFSILTVLLASCSDDETSRRDSRDRQGPQDESRDTDDEEPQGEQIKATPSNKPKDLIFPLDLTHHRELHILGQNDSQIQLSVRPKEKPLRLLAGWSGQVSIETENSAITLTLYSSRHNKSIHYILSEADTTLQASDGQSVQQKDILAETTHPLIFSISHEGDPTPICLSVNNLSQKIKVVENIPSSGC